MGGFLNNNDYLALSNQKILKGYIHGYIYILIPMNIVECIREPHIGTLLDLVLNFSMHIYLRPDIGSRYEINNCLL